MVIVEISKNPNCAAVDARVFHELEPPRRVRQVRLERHPRQPRWYDVSGWTVTGRPRPAIIQKVDDSGEGVAFLVYGGDAGLRLKPAGQDAPWRLDDPEQWGEPYLLVSDLSDAQVVEQAWLPHAVRTELD